MRAIIERHSEIAASLRASGSTREAFEDARKALRRLATALHTANDAQRKALDGMIAANEAALALDNGDSEA